MHTHTHTHTETHTHIHTHTHVCTSWWPSSWQHKPNLYDLGHEPGDALQVGQSDLLLQRLLQTGIVRGWQLHAREQVRDDALKQRDVMRQKLQHKQDKNMRHRTKMPHKQDKNATPTGQQKKMQHKQDKLQHKQDKTAILTGQKLQHK